MAGQEAALSGGVQAALAVGAVIATVALGLSFRQRTPAQELGDPSGSHDPMGEFERDLACDSSCAQT